MTGDPTEPAAHCPRCGTEYRAGFTVCADDGTELVPGPAPQPGKPASAQTRGRPSIAGPAIRWVAVASFAKEDEARLLAGRLEAEGIEAEVYPPFQGSYYGESVLLPIRVMVPEHRALEARAVVEAIGFDG